MFIALTLVIAKAYSEPLLDDLQHRAVRFFWEQSAPETGFTKDRATNSEGVDIHTIASCAATGFALVAGPIGVERGWLNRRDALERARVTLRALNRVWPNEHGWLYHFVDWKTGERQWKSEASTIDTSICLAGVVDAVSYWHDPELTREAEKFENRIDWSWARTNGGASPAKPFVSMGYHPEDGFIRSDWSSFNELKMLYLQAYAFAPEMPADAWDRVAKDERSFKQIHFLVGGPLFMHQMSESFYDFRHMRDRSGFDYGVETRNATLANRAYCIDNPKKFSYYGPDFWGLSACDTPDGYDALGAPGDIRDNGTITPTSAMASLPYTTDLSLDFLANMRGNHRDAWGRYGFPNGYNPTRKWIDPDALGIDLGMMLLGVEDYRSGLPWKLSLANPHIKNAYQKMGFRKTSGSGWGPLRKSRG